MLIPQVGLTDLLTGERSAFPNVWKSEDFVRNEPLTVTARSFTFFSNPHIFFKMKIMLLSQSRKAFSFLLLEKEMFEEFKIFKHLNIFPVLSYKSLFERSEISI